MLKWKCKINGPFPTHLTSASPGSEVGDGKREKWENTSFTGMTSVERLICGEQDL